MISKEENPVEWAAFLYELEDAKEHLESLIKDIQTDPEYDENVLRIDLGHVYSHLNRAWQRQKLARDFSDEEWTAASQFPNDLPPA